MAERGPARAANLRPVTAVFYLWRYPGGTGFAAGATTILTGLWATVMVYSTATLIASPSIAGLFGLLIVGGEFGVGIAFIWMPVRRAIARRRASR